MNILTYPLDKDNPYQNKLYEHIINNGHTVKIISSTRIGIILFPLILAQYRLRGFNIFHLHWPNFFTTVPKPIAKKLSYILTTLILTSVRLLGYRFVWTIHNVLPHEEQTSNDSAVSRMISRLADANIVHSQHTITQMTELGMDTSNVHIIPHGNYEGVYPNDITRSRARNRLGIKKAETVVLFFGNIRPYKGVDNLILAFSELDIENTRLIIAGKCDDNEIERYRTLSHKNKNIIFLPGRVEDKNIATYFKAADIVCLPFKSITTSGSALLALTFGKPLVAPYIGAIQDIPKEVGILYNPNKKDALKSALSKALNNTDKLPLMAKASRAYAKTLSWDVIAEKTYKIYEEVLPDK